ncbi:hypothetical protein LCGC14_2484930 [marine sediment metagenome]|uniref:Uncharacterized protein n=1 Tax=marine sediment metagenome TaxID=412755 RepID=A0A0F9DIE1_9ZZZZ
MKLVRQGDCIIVCHHISIYFNNDEDVKKISVQCKVCTEEFSLKEAFDK